MEFNKNILKEYLVEAPIPLALERTWECEIYKTLEFPRPILDVGCGDGIYTKILFAEKIDVGIDPLEYELEYARKLDVYEKLTLAWGNEMPFENETFKTVFSNSVLEHIPDIEPVLNEIHRVLKSDGNLYVTIPTNLFDTYSVIYRTLQFFGLNGLKESYRKFFNKFWKHHHYYTRKDWITLFQKCGFEMVTVQEYGTKQQCTFNDFIVPFTIPNYVVKKLFNRFFLSKTIRRIYVPVLAGLIKHKVKIHPGLTTGGLIFFSFKKNNGSIEK